jgi:hypothetical protein
MREMREMRGMRGIKKYCFLISPYSLISLCFLISPYFPISRKQPWGFGGFVCSASVADIVDS